MTIADFINSLAPFGKYLLCWFSALPVVTFLYGAMIPKAKGHTSPHCYIYAVCIYLAAIPGIFSIVLTGYALFILKANLLKVNFIVYFLPILSMILTILSIRRVVNLDHIPGFDRIYGLFILLGVSFIFSLILLKTRIWLVFGGPFTMFIILTVTLFLLLKWAARRVFQGKDRPKYPRLP